MHPSPFLTGALLRARRSAVVCTAAAFAAVTGSALAATYVYEPTNGSTVWSTGAGWSPSAPIGDFDTRLTFVGDNATVIPDGLVNTNTIDEAGEFLANIVDLQGTGAAGGTGVINIAHTAPSTGLVLLGTSSTINLNAMNGAGGSLTYNISAPVQLPSTQGTITGDGTATFNFTGGISGFRIFKSGSSTLTLGGTSAIRTFEIGRDALGGTVVAAPGSNITIGEALGNNPGGDLNVGFTIDNTTVDATSTFDASAAGTLVVNVGTIRVGNMLGGNGTGIGHFKLGANNDLTASNWFLVGYSNNSFKTPVSTLTTANGGTTNISTPRFTIGGAKANASFVAGAGSTINIDGFNGDARATFEVGHFMDNVGGSGPWAGSVDLSGATLNASLNRLIVGRLWASGSASETGTLVIGDSASNHLDIRGTSAYNTNADGGVVQIGTYQSGSGTATGSVTIGNLDATSIVESTNNGSAIVIGDGGVNKGTGTLTLNGGTLELRTTGAGIRGGTGTSTVNFNGTTLKVGANSTDWIRGLTTANVQAGGLRIDTNGFNAGSTQAFSGTGGLVKLGTGTLTLTGASTFTGTTAIEAGVLEIAGSGKLASLNIVVLETAINLTINTANPLAENATLSLAGGGTEGAADAGFLNLLADATVGFLILDGVAYGEGTYGSTASTADHQFDEFFSGAGVLTVTAIPEPGVLGLLGLAAAVGVFALRRRS